MSEPEETCLWMQIVMLTSLYFPFPSLWYSPTPTSPTSVGWQSCDPQLSASVWVGALPLAWAGALSLLRAGALCLSEQEQLCLSERGSTVYPRGSTTAAFPVHKCSPRLSLPGLAVSVLGLLCLQVSRAVISSFFCPWPTSHWPCRHLEPAFCRQERACSHAPEAVSRALGDDSARLSHLFEGQCMAIG